MRAAAGLALLLAGCSPAASGAPPATADTIDCAVNGAASFAHDCTVEHGRQDGAPMLVVRHPDGGFRRFKVLDGGQSLAPADGADALAIARNGRQVDISVNGDRYRFPNVMLRDDSK